MNKRLVNFMAPVGLIKRLDFHSYRTGQCRTAVMNRLINDYVFAEDSKVDFTSALYRKQFLEFMQCDGAKLGYAHVDADLHSDDFDHKDELLYWSSWGSSSNDPDEILDF